MPRSFTTKLAAACAALFAITAVLGGVGLARTGSDAGATLWIGALIALSAITGAALVAGLARAASTPAIAPGDLAHDAPPEQAGTLAGLAVAFHQANAQLASVADELQRVTRLAEPLARNAATGAHQAMTASAELARMAAELKQLIHFQALSRSRRPSAGQPCPASYSAN